VRIEAGFHGVGLPFPAVAAGRSHAAADLPAVLLPPQDVATRGLRARPEGTLVRVPGGVPPAVGTRLADLTRFEATVRQAAGKPTFGAESFELVTPGPSAAWKDGRLDVGGVVPEDSDVRALAAAGFVGAAAVVVFAVALATLDRRRADELLVVLGAPARARRVVGAIQAGTLAAVGSVLAVAVGTAATAIGFVSYNRARTGPPPIPFVFPWTVALLLLVALPLVAAGLTSLLTPTIRSVDLHRLAD
jgi:hypothetical protein